MESLKRLADLLALLLDAVITSFFAIILVITILQVVLRYGFNESILFGNELMEGLFIYTTSIGAAVAVRRRQHINISYLVEKLPDALRRISDALVHLLVAFLNGVMIFYSIRWISKVGSNESPVMRVPEWIFQASVPIGCSLVIAYCLVMVFMGIRDDKPSQGDGPC
ncbi:MAG: TRAP transporter small permease [Desulfofustis sp.]|jgi:TRAP-type C4-dicarboxylate transport system permease small subunit|nr:TRAP transporter small permease [Desulfofustis sp.]